MSNSGSRLNIYKKPALTAEVAYEELKSRQDEDMRPAQVLQQSLDHSKWQTPGLGASRPVTDRPRS